ILSFAIGAVWGRRSALRRYRTRSAKRGDGSPKRLGLDTSYPAPLLYKDDMEIPSALIGARSKALIERFAPMVGMTPVNLLREALARGLTGEHSVTEVLELLDKEEDSTELPPTSKPGPSRPN